MLRDMLRGVWVMLQAYAARILGYAAVYAAEGLGYAAGYAAWDFGSYATGSASSCLALLKKLVSQIFKMVQTYFKKVPNL